MYGEDVGDGPFVVGGNEGVCRVDELGSTGSHFDELGIAERCCYSIQICIAMCNNSMVKVKLCDSSIFYSLSQLCLCIVKTQQASPVPEASPAYKRCLCFFHSISTSLPHPSTVLPPFGHLFKHNWLQLPSYPHQNRPPPASFPPLAPLVCRSHLKPGLHLRLFQVINSHQQLLLLVLISLYVMVAEKRQKSCASCITAKRKCDKARPFCRRCEDKGLDCRYAVLIRRAVAKSIPSDEPTEIPGKWFKSVFYHE